MIQMKTELVVADNSGAKIVECISPLKASYEKHASVGDIVVVAVKAIDPASKAKKGVVRKAVVVRTKSCIYREDGTTLRFDDNAVVMLDEKGEPSGTRVFGPVARELRGKGFMKIVSLAPEVV